jgi:hypothetical protein
MSMVGFPLLLIPLAVYNMIAFLMPSVTLAEPVFTVPLPSGAAWPVSLSDMLLALGVVLLLLEVMKGARPGAKFLTDHLLSLVVFAGAAAEFLLLPKFGSSTFFLLALLSCADFLSGIALRTQRGTAAAAKLAPAPVRKLEPSAPEPQPDPAPTPAVVVEPAAAEHVEPVVTERIEPVIAHEEVAPAPSVSSPGLQPSQETPPPDTPPR